MKLFNYSELNESLIYQYKTIVRQAFPNVIFQSDVVNRCWPRIEEYFPEYQLFYVDEYDDIVGFINSIPVYWDRSLDELPDEGWDWLVEAGLEGYERGRKPNCLGGLQIIVAPNHLGRGISKKLIAEGKKVQERLGYENFIIPIRPTFKSQYPEMDMEEYIDFKKDGKIYDPWIRTHLSAGAEKLKVCPNAMNIRGDLAAWEALKKQKIHTSGYHIVEGALNPVFVDVEKEFGEYREANIWINYKLIAK